MTRASTVIKNIDDLASVVKKSGIQNSKGVVNDAMFRNNGTGSFVLDFLTGNKLGKSKAYRNMQRKITDLDMRAGGKAYDFFDKRKSKALNSVKNSFVQDQEFLKKRNGATDEYIKVKTTGLLNPISKTKEKVLPVVGSMTVANHLLADKRKEGDNQ